MSRTFEALKRAERSRLAGLPRAGVSDHRPTSPPWNGHAARVEYERLRVWITTPPLPEDRIQTPIQTVLVVGCHAGSGTTTVAAHLAAALAALPSSRVLLVDANLRRPCLDRFFGLPATPGLLQALNGNGAGGHEQPSVAPNLFVLTAGQGADGTGGVLDGSSVERLLGQLRPRFQHIVLDTAPLPDFPDAYAFARNVDAVVLVVEAERTPLDAARRIAQDLRQTGARRVGVVLNRQQNYVPRILRRFFGQPS